MLAAPASARIARLRIDHVPNALLFRAALRPGELEKHATYTIETRNRTIVDAIVEAYERVSSEAVECAADLRYALSFEDARGRLYARVYFDAAGTRGEIDGRAVRFATNELKASVVGAFPILAK